MCEERKPITDKDVQGLKYFRRLLPLFERLHEVGCERDKAGNRQLHMDQYCALVLLFMFNPCVRSLRALQQASQLKNVQKKLGCPRTSLGSLSEATDVFDPERLREIIGELAESTRPIRDVAGKEVQQLLTAVDGSVVKTLSTIAEAAFMKDCHGRSRSAWRLHTHFDIDRGVPTRIDVTSGSNGGKSDEKNVLRKTMQADHCYVMDRWYAQFQLFNDIHAIDSSYVCRVKKSSSYQVQETRELTEQAKAVNILSDEVVALGARQQPGKCPDHPVRLICVKIRPHEKKGGRGRGDSSPPSDGILRIVTNLLDPPAELIAEIYQQRWTIEIFFRFFKHILGCRHLLSTDPVGIEIQAYCAIIACLLISLTTGCKPTQRSYEMVCLYLQGWANEEELLTHIQKLKPQA